MKVLHVGKFFPPVRGGIETYLADLVRAQRAAGIDAHAIVHGEPLPDDPPWLMRVPVVGRWLHVPVAPGFRAALRRCIEQQAPDVLHLHMPNAAALLVLSLRPAASIPWVVHWHADVRVTPRRDLLALAYEAYRPLELSVLERAARVIVTSPPYRDASRALAPFAAKLRVIPLGIDMQPPPVEASGELPWRTGALRVLTLGRLTHYKGFETLIDAVAPLADAHCVIAGDGTLHAALRSRIESHVRRGAPAHVTLMGGVDEATKQRLFASCDLFCLPSVERTEAFGLVLLEALAHGKPILASDLPGSGMAWIVAESGGGQTVATGDASAWRSAIESLRDDPARRAALGATGRERAVERFAIARSASEVGALYRDVLPHLARAPGPGDVPVIVLTAVRITSAVVEQVVALRAAGWSQVAVVAGPDAGDDALLREAGAEVLRPVVRLGPWGLLQTGLRHARSRHAAGVVAMDAGRIGQAAALPRLLEAGTSADIVVAADPARGSALRRRVRATVAPRLGLPVRDPSSPIRYFGRAALEALADADVGGMDAHHLGALLLARRRGLRVAEVEVEAGTSGEPGWRRFGSLAAVLRYSAGTALLCAAHLRLWHARGSDA